MDIVLSAAGLLLLAPVLLLAAVAVALDSAGPVLFRQTRLGLHGHEFGIFKFRSMGYSPPGAADAGPYFTVANDPRITRIGHFLRRSSIDELPQLFNVLMGDMSLVGPRPDLPAQRSGYAPADWATRCSVRPGITGLAQAQLRSQATPAERLALDLQYARKRSLLLDAKIMLWTLQRAGGKGAN